LSQTYLGRTEKSAAHLDRSEAKHSGPGEFPFALQPEPPYMTGMIKRIYLIGTPVLLGLLGLGTAFDVIPSNWTGFKSLVSLANDWLVRHAAFPGLVAMIATVFIAIYVIPVGVVVYLRLQQAEPPPVQDMRIDEAIDYLVNDSRLVLKQPEPPVVITEGPGKGLPMRWGGVQHKDAKNLLHERLVDGQVQSWGRKTYGTRMDDHGQPIPSAYWLHAALNELTVFHDSNDNQTVRSDPNHRVQMDLFAKLMVNRKQLQRVFPRKSLWRRLSEWKRPRVKP
jgi:hypothetical protein